MAGLQHKARTGRSDNRPLSVFVVGVAVAMGLWACDPKPPVVPKVRARVKVQAFTEVHQAHQIVATDDELFVATDAGLERWNLVSEEHLLINKDHGLPGQRVLSMAMDQMRSWLWMATDVGIGRYEVSNATFSELPPPPEVLGLTSFEDLALAPAGDGGLWIGSATGLFYVDAQGNWSNTGVERPVTSLRRDESGELWIGASEGVLFVAADGQALPLGVGDGCDLFEVRDLVPAGTRRAWALAKGPAGQPRIGLLTPTGCTTYEAPSGHSVQSLVRQGPELFALTPRGLFMLDDGNREGMQRLDRKGFRFNPIRRPREAMEAPKSLRFEATGLKLPRKARITTSNARELFVGTASLGTVRLQPRNPRVRPRWLRRSDLTRDARRLSVACSGPTRCFVATGGKELWLYDGKGFRNVGDETVTHSVVRLDDGRILFVRDSLLTPEEAQLAAEAGQQQAVVSLAEWGDEGFAELPGIRIATPGGSATIREVRQAPTGLLWISLSYESSEQGTMPYGVALVDLGLSLVAYHHASFDRSETAQGILPIPVDVSGICFLGGDEVWLATSQGAARIVGDDIKIFIESDGLRSELLRSTVCSSGGMVYTASSQGVGSFDGDKWTYAHELRTTVNDLALSKDGRLWLATRRGLGVYDGSKVLRLDTRRGLVENELLNVESDHLGRIWVRSASGLVLVSP